jgi:hypothetical protein
VLKQLQRLPFAPVVALMFAAVAALLVLATPVWLLEHAVLAAGLPDVLPAAAPPLGMKARFLLVFLAGGGAAVVAFVAALPFRNAKPRKPQAVTVQPLRRDAEEAPIFNRPSVFAAPALEDEPNLPSFLAQPLAQLVDESLPPAQNEEDELLLDALMIVEEAPAAPVVPMTPDAVFMEAIHIALEDVPLASSDLPQMPDIFIQPETVLHLAPAPVPPPVDPIVEDAPRLAPRPRIVEPREPTIAELMERFQRGLETLTRTDPQALEDVPLRDALTRLERIAVGGR